MLDNKKKKIESMKRSQLHCSICDRMLLDLFMNIIFTLD